MKNKLYIAGDSFASLSKNQSKGSSWSEILSNDLNLDLCNIARPAASNFSIALQIEWIRENVKSNDLVIVFLTDHYRKALVDLAVNDDSEKSLLELHSLHDHQKPSEHIEYSKEPRIICSYIYHKDRIAKEYYKNWFDLRFQETEDRLLITGALSNLTSITDNFIVCRGGFKEDDESISHLTFNITPNQYLEITSKILLDWSEPSEYINHIDDLTHKKLASKLKNKLNTQ